MDSGQFLEQEIDQNSNRNDRNAGFKAWSWLFVSSNTQIW